MVSAWLVSEFKTSVVGRIIKTVFSVFISIWDLFWDNLNSNASKVLSLLAFGPIERRGTACPSPVGASGFF